MRILSRDVSRSASKQIEKKSKKRKVYAVRRHNWSLQTWEQPGLAALGQALGQQAKSVTLD